jgi:heme/copper-type cytochrome/quinol oxidase subunit 4
MTELQEQNRGLIAIAVLAVLTVIEYVAAVGIDSTTVVVTLLAVIGVVKALVIMEYFMHISKLWRGEGEHA